MPRLSSYCRDSNLESRADEDSVAAHRFLARTNPLGFDEEGSLSSAKVFAHTQLVAEGRRALASIRVVEFANETHTSTRVEVHSVGHSAGVVQQNGHVSIVLLLVDVDREAIASAHLAGASGVVQIAEFVFDATTDPLLSAALLCLVIRRQEDSSANAEAEGLAFLGEGLRGHGGSHDSQNTDCDCSFHP